MKQSAALTAKTYRFLTDNNNEYKKAKWRKVCLKLMFKNYKNCLKATELENKISQLEKRKLM